MDSEVIGDATVLNVSRYFGVPLERISETKRVSFSTEFAAGEADGDSLQRSKICLRLTLLHWHYIPFPEMQY